MIKNSRLTFTIPGYSITTVLHTGTRATVYSATDEQTGTPVVIKILNTENPEIRELILFRNQYALQNINHPNIIKCYDLKPYNQSYALILEDFGGISLHEYTRVQPLDIKEFLNIAIEITKGLECLYENRIIHLDIKPKNILINSVTKAIKLIDFSISSLLPKESAEIKNPHVLLGTLPYMSPEQTGRMNRGIDYRSDLYSFGITCYELLTGKLPFDSKNPLEIIHCHLAKEAINPCKINPKIPEIIAKIIIKLMAKTAEERYQTARGIRHDLEKCQQILCNQGEIKNIELGERDKSDHFLIPEKIYGREIEIKTLLNAFTRVSNGSKELILVSGYSGIGKTSVVNEVHKPIVRQKGYFISGKFDQFQRDIPFSALVQAFRYLMGQLLTESTHQLKEWKSQILSALGEQAGVLIEVIPELKLIIGQQPQIQELTGNSAQNRFNLLFGKFIQILATKSHPLVIFLDDLQWADSASLKLIQLLMSEMNTEYLLLICAYRNNEVNAVHPFIMTLEEIRKTQTSINEISLNPLGEFNLNQLVCDALNCQKYQGLLLTKLILTKTGGNPFFSNQLLKSWQEEGVIKFDYDAGYWQYNIIDIQSLYLNNDVVELLAIQLDKISKNSQDALKKAACIGNQFDLHTLSVVCEKSESAIATDLWKALQEGLILPKDEFYKLYQNQSFISDDEKWKIDHKQVTVTYKFLHDRVQQAAYSLIPEDEKKATHLKIGQLIYKNTSPEELESNIFEIVNHLNMGIDLITSQTEKTELAKLNLIAGDKAKSSTAYLAALNYLNVSRGLLEVNSWTSKYELTLKIYTKITEIKYLTNDFEQSKEFAKFTIQQAKTVLDQVKLYQIQILACVGKNQMSEALDIGIQVLRNLGVILPGKATRAHFFASVVQTKLMLLGKQVEDLATLPRMTDPYKLAAAQILSILFPAASQAGSLYFPLTVLEMVRLSIKYGNSDVSSVGYIVYGAILCAKFNEIETGYKFGQLGLNLMENMNAIFLKCKVYFLFNTIIYHFKKPANKTINPLREVMQIGLETGDIEYVIYAHSWLLYLLFLSGENLGFIEQKIQDYIELRSNSQINKIVLIMIDFRNIILSFMGRLSEKLNLISEVFNEHEIMINVGNNYSYFNQIYFLRISLNYFFEDYVGVIQSAKIINHYQDSDPGFLFYLVTNFYYSLALLAHYNHVSFSEQKQYLKQVAINQKKMELWAYHAPCNFQHKYDLVAAEKARVLGKKSQAIDLYERAIKGARENEYIQEEALANELTAKFYLADGKEKLAQLYLIDACYGYSHWGAKAKVENLQQRYPQLLTNLFHQKNISLTPNDTVNITSNLITSSSSSTISAILDLETITKAALAIASEIHIDKLLHTLMQVILENVGADKATLILQQEENLTVAAQSQEAQQFSLLFTPIENYQNLPLSIINYVLNTQKDLLIDDATTQTNFAADPYIIQAQVKSILCNPIINQGKLIGILYLENSLTKGVFTPERLQILKLISSQTAISLENAQFYAKLEDKVATRTQELNQKNQQLQETLQELKRTQSQLIQTEKMSSLGQIVAGVAHELNNPVSFIHGNLAHISEYTQNLLALIDIYQEIYPDNVDRIDDFFSNFDLDFLREDIPKTLASMKMGTQRIREIVLTLRNFSRLDEAEMKPVNIHEGIDSTLLILQSRLQSKSSYSPIEIIKNYGNLPKIECYAGQLNQVFMNILNNAIDALDRFSQELMTVKTSHDLRKIIIQTQVVNSDWVAISIKDNGGGMSSHIKQKLFEPFFTTKPIGQGTGLGLSICYQIIVDKHHGKIECFSEPGQGAEFFIQIPIK